MFEEKGLQNFLQREPMSNYPCPTPHTPTSYSTLLELCPPPTRVLCCGSQTVDQRLFVLFGVVHMIRPVSVRVSCFLASVSSSFHSCFLLQFLVFVCMVVSSFIAPVTDLHSVVAMVFTHDPVWCLTMDSLETLHLGKYKVTTLVPCSEPLQ